MITPIYAALLAIFYVFLSVRTLRLRRTLKIGIGSGDNEMMLRATRVHSNFAEYVPLALLLALMYETIGGAQWLIHLACILLFMGRLVHAFGVSKVKENYRFRVFGMACTFTTILTLAFAILRANFL